MRRRVHALCGEPLGQHPQVRTDVCVRGKLLVGVGDQPLDRLHGVPALEAHG
nr:hypothetical protein [Streptomyces aureus]